MHPSTTGTDEESIALVAPHLPKHADAAVVNAAHAGPRRSRSRKPPPGCGRIRGVDNDDRRSALATAALCSCTFCNAYVIISVFPYAGYMVLAVRAGPGGGTRSSNVADNDAVVGLSAGLLASSFFAARFAVAYQWGRIADAAGRTRTLQAALALSAIFSIFFGCSASLPAALLWRSCLGFSNGIISTVKTVATELSDDEALQRRTMGLVVGMRSWGMLIAPAIAGFLAEPLKQYPAVFFNDDGGDKWTAAQWIPRLLESYPFLLPNLFGAACCVTAMVAVHFFLPETLPDRRDGNDDDDDDDATSESSTAADDERPLVLELPRIRKVEIADPTTARVEQSMTPPRPHSAWSRPLTRNHLLSDWMFSIASTYIDEAFPLFCMAARGGLALSEAGIGTILSGAGLIFAITQYATFATLTHRFGLYKSLSIGCLLGTLPAVLMPLSLLLRRKNTVTRGGMVFLSAVMGFTKLMHSLYFTSMAVAVNKTVDSSQRARLNALAMTGNSLAKAIGPSFAGGVITFSFSAAAFPAKYGSVLVWSLVPVMGLIVAHQIHRLRRQVDASET